MTPPPPRAALLSLRGVCKQFGAVTALTDVDVDFYGGEIHAVLGENGAGKSTLMNAIYGLTGVDAGTIFWRSEPVRFDSCLAARDAGIGMVHQEFSLVEALSVLENLTLSMSAPGAFRWERQEIAAMAARLASDIGLEIGDVNTPVHTLPVGRRQRIEILKALAGNVDLLILDEPTAVLTPQESDQLFDVLARLRERGTAIVFITHRLSEVVRIADRITVLRSGKVVAQRSRADASEADLARLMVGDLPERGRRASRPTRTDTPPLLKLEGLAACDESGATALHDVDLEVAAGEVLGIAGVDGNGQSELFRAVTGLTRPIRGRVMAAGTVVTGFAPASMIAAGIGNVPPHRLRQGVVADMSIRENAVLNSAILGRLARGPFLPLSAIDRVASQLTRDHAIKAEDLDLPVSTLSGGNMQRLIVARAIAARPRVLIAFNPTRGLDIRAAEAVYAALDRAVDGGTAVLLLSTDIDEILTNSHRIAVLSRGRLSDALLPPFRVAPIARLMAGLSPLA